MKKLSSVFAIAVTTAIMRASAASLAHTIVILNCASVLLALDREVGSKTAKNRTEVELDMGIVK